MDKVMMGFIKMQGELNGLGTLILKEIESAFYIHCFAHKRQLALIAVTKNHVEIVFFFFAWLIMLLLLPEHHVNVETWLEKYKPKIWKLFKIIRS